MGMAPCYTLHSDITLEGQQIATQLLTAAGANYFMDVYLNTDRMLAYFDTSGHDDQTLREVHGLEPAPEYLAWALERGIFDRDEDGTVVRGPRWGDVGGSVPATATWPAGRSGCPRPTASRTRARGPRTPSRGRCGRTSRSRARRSAPTSTRNGWATSPSRGSPPQRRTARRTSPTPARARACRPMRSPRCRRARTTSSIVVSDGLSAEAVHHAVPELLPVLLDGLAGGGASVATPLLLHRGRVKAAERIADALACRLVVMLIGERPGGDANASRSMSAYLVLRLSGDERSRAAAFSGNPDVRFEYSVVSNIHAGGLPPVEAGGVVARQALDILDRGAAGNRLAAMA